MADNRRVVGAVAGAAAGVVLLPVVAPLALAPLGFGAAGIISGSLAAMIQALIGNITAGSLFAVLQSIGMGGAIPAIASAVAAIFGAGVGAGVATAAAGGGPNDEDPDGEGPAVDNAPGGDAGW